MKKELLPPKEAERDGRALGLILVPVRREEAGVVERRGRSNEQRKLQGRSNLVRYLRSIQKGSEPTVLQSARPAVSNEDCT